MNGKKARAIRKTSGKNGASIKQVAYENQMHNKFTPFNAKTGMGGKQLFTTKRVANCGRSLYQQAKGV